MKKNGPDSVKGFFYSLAGVMLLSTNFVTAKYGLKGFNPETFSLIWTTAAAIYSFLIVLIRKDSREQLRCVHNIKAMFALGSATALTMILAWNGLAILDPAFASFLWRFFPVLAILSGVLFLKERLSRQEVMAMGIMLLGSFCSVAGRWEAVGKGVILTFLAACAGTVQLLIAKSQTNRIHPNILVGYRVGIASLLIAAWTFGSGKADFDAASSYWCVTLLGAFLGPCASFLCTFRAYRYWSLSQSSMVLTIQPLLVLPLAFIFLGSMPTVKGLVGGGMIMIGALWIAYIHVNRKKPELLPLEAQ